MCGIAGAVGPGEISLEALKMMGHRGPDQTNYHSDGNVWLGHTRLAIQGLGLPGEQPKIKRGCYSFVFNGEIYNHRQLSKKYFRQEFLSDTEFLFRYIILKLESNREGWARDLVELKGMWSFALHDLRKGKLYLCRDLFGKKPVFYHAGRKSFSFASELTALDKIAGLEEKHKDPTILYECLKYRFSHSDSIYLDYPALEKGSVLEVNTKNLRLREFKYFRNIDLIKEKIPYTLKNDNLSRLEEALTKSVGARLTSDVPVGSITSGGLDSSLISAIAASRNPNLHLFNVDVKGKSEARYAELLANSIGCPLTKAKFDGADFKELYEFGIQTLSYPLVHPNSLALLRLAEQANELGFKVLLSGEGADELFGGYSNAELLSKFMSLPIPLMKCKPKLKEALGQLVGFDVKAFFQISPGQNNFLPVEDSITSVFEEYFEYYNQYYRAKEAAYSAFLATQQEFYTRPILLRADRVFMAHSIELRNPFFDQDLIQEVLLTPPKIRQSKFILRSIAKRYIPKEIINRAKFGFNVSVTFSSPSDSKKANNDQFLIKDSYLRIKV